MQWISIRETNCFVHWIGIYPGDIGRYGYSSVISYQVFCCLPFRCLYLFCSGSNCIMASQARTLLMTSLSFSSTFCLPRCRLSSVRYLIKISLILYLQKILIFIKPDRTVRLVNLWYTARRYQSC